MFKVSLSIECGAFISNVERTLIYVSGTKDILEYGRIRIRQVRLYMGTGHVFSKGTEITPQIQIRKFEEHMA